MPLPPRNQWRRSRPLLSTARLAAKSGPTVQTTAAAPMLNFSCPAPAAAVVTRCPEARPAALGGASDEGQLFHACSGGRHRRLQRRPERVAAEGLQLRLPSRHLRLWNGVADGRCSAGGMGLHPGGGRWHHPVPQALINTIKGPLPPVRSALPACAGKQPGWTGTTALPCAPALAGSGGGVAWDAAGQGGRGMACAGRQVPPRQSTAAGQAWRARPSSAPTYKPAPLRQGGRASQQQARRVRTETTREKQTAKQLTSPSICSTALTDLATAAACQASGG